MRRQHAAAAALLAWCLSGISTAAAAAEQIIFVVRHAERADAAGAGPPPAGMMANDPPLSAAGHERAKRLAATLASAGVKHIFTTDLARTRQTAAPLAESIQVKPSAVASRDVPALAQQVRSAAGPVLVVGHSNTVPELLKQLGVQAPASIGESEYDNLFVVFRPAAGEPTLVRLRY
jgi:broad specificity phosphatase PhoE